MGPGYAQEFHACGLRSTILLCRLAELHDWTGEGIGRRIVKDRIESLPRFEGSATAMRRLSPGFESPVTSVTSLGSGVWRVPGPPGHPAMCRDGP